MLQEHAFKQIDFGANLEKHARMGHFKVNEDMESKYRS